MAKKATKKGKKPARASSTKVQVTVPLAAMPGRACFAAGRVIADAKNAVENLSRSLESKKGPVDGRLLARVSGRFQQVGVNFPLTRSQVEPFDRKFFAYSTGRVARGTIEKLVKEAVQELAILEGKAMEVCK